MTLCGFDPGTTESGWCLWDTTISRVIKCAIEDNEAILCKLRHNELCAPWYIKNHFVIESVECYGMPVGKETFATVEYIGRVKEAMHGKVETHMLSRRKVKLYLCNSMRAKDSNIRRALIDKIGVVGTKKSPGPLYGVKKHIWSALALAVTYADLRATE